MPVSNGKDRDNLISDIVTIKKRHAKDRSILNVEGNVVVVSTLNSSVSTPNYDKQSGLTIQGTDTVPSVIRMENSISDKILATVKCDYSGGENQLDLSVSNDSQVTQNSVSIKESKSLFSGDVQIGESLSNKALTVYGNTTINGTLDPTTLSLGSYTNLETKIGDIDTAISAKHPTISTATNLSVGSIVAYNNNFMTLEGATVNDFQCNLALAQDPSMDFTVQIPQPTATTVNLLYDESSLNADNIASGNLNEARLPVHPSLSAKLYINNSQQLITDTTTASYTGLYINGNSYFDGSVHTEQGIRLDDSGIIVPSSGNIAIEPVSTEIIMKGNLRLHNDDLTAGPLLKAGNDSNITVTLPTSTGTLSLKAPVDTNTINISANTSKNLLEEIVLCPTTYDLSGNVETGSDIDISSYVSRVTTSGTPTLERLTAVQTLSATSETDIDGTLVSYFLPPSGTNHITISYDLQFSYSNKTSAMFSACLMCSFNGGTFYPVFNSLRGVGQASAWRMETISIQSTLHHNGTASSESYINSGLLNINGLSDSDYWSFKLVGCRYSGSSSWGSIDIHEGHYFNSNMWSSDFLSATPLLAPPHIKISFYK